MMHSRHQFLVQMPKAKVSWLLCIGRLVSKTDNVMHFARLLEQASATGCWSLHVERIVLDLRSEAAWVLIPLGVILPLLPILSICEKLQCQKKWYHHFCESFQRSPCHIPIFSDTQKIERLSLFWPSKLLQLFLKHGASYRAQLNIIIIVIIQDIHKFQKMAIMTNIQCYIAQLLKVKCHICTGWRLNEMSVKSYEHLDSKAECLTETS